MLKLTPKQKIWVRVAIYVPLILFFGYGALKAHWARTAAESEAPLAPTAPETPELEGTKREIQLPNGQVVTITEMTEEQARAQGFVLPPDGDAEAKDKERGDADADAEAEAESQPGAEPSADTETGTATP